MTAMTSEVGDNVKQKKKLFYKNQDRHTYKRLIDYNLERTTLQSGRAKLFVDWKIKSIPTRKSKVEHMIRVN